MSFAPAVESNRAVTDLDRRAEIQYANPIKTSLGYTIETGGIDASFQHHNREVLAGEIASQAVAATQTRIMAALDSSCSPSAAIAEAKRSADHLMMDGSHGLSLEARGDWVREQVATMAKDRVGDVATLAARVAAERRKPENAPAKLAAAQLPPLDPFARNQAADPARERTPGLAANPGSVLAMGVKAGVKAAQEEIRAHALEEQRLADRIAAGLQAIRLAKQEYIAMRSAGKGPLSAFNPLDHVPAELRKYVADKV